MDSEREQDRELGKFKKYVLKNGCPVNVKEDIFVSVPVIVRAHADVGDVDLHCMGCHVEKNGKPRGKPHACSKFTINQQMQITIPITFIADADVGEGHVDFDLHECQSER